MDSSARAPGPVKILLVEDTRTITALIKVYLLHLTCEFLEAPDGEEALTLARAHKPRLIISDVNMPRMDGFTLCAAVRADPDLNGTPVVLLTSHGDAASRKKAMLVGATAFLTKPIGVAELRARVDEALRR